MKIKYEFADETVEIEVDDTWGAVLVELDRQEYNNRQAETRRHCSFEACDQDSNQIPSDEDLPSNFEITEKNRKLYLAIKKLEPRQQYLIEQVYFLRRKQKDIAAEEGVSCAAICRALKRAENKLKKFLS